MRDILGRLRDVGEMMRHAIKSPTLCDVLALACMLGGVLGGVYILATGGTLSDAGLSLFIGALASGLFIFD